MVLGTMACDPYAGMAWMHMQLAAGLLELGHDVSYVEATSRWPYDPVRGSSVQDSDYAVPYLARVAESFGLGERWAYRRSYGDGAWLGPVGDRAPELLRSADAVLNVAAATDVRGEGLEVGRLVYFGTDPVFTEVAYADGDLEVRAFVDAHDDVVTYGENIGREGCPLEPLPRLRAWTRQPVLVHLWRDGAPTRPEYTTVANWSQAGPEVVVAGERYFWSKDREFATFRELPRRVGLPFELATNLGEPESFAYGEGDPIPAFGLAGDARSVLEENGWRLVDARTFTTDPWRYRDYVRASRAAFSVARDLNVRLRSGWFSERDACYLAAGRPVVAQATGFERVLPTGEGLFAVASVDEAQAAVEAIESHYERHSRAAQEVADEYFSSSKVLPKLLSDLL